MAYSNYNQYSPYWQQTTGQTTSQDAGHNVGQPRTAYQPLSAYQNNHQSSQSSISQQAGNSSGVYAGQGYGNVNMSGAGNARPQDSRAGYANTNDRASIDGATALGNLAYASSLGRDGSIQQMSNNSRQQSSANYGTASLYGVGSASPIQYRTGDERRDSNGSSREGNTRSQQATASPSFGYSANNAGHQAPSASSSTQAQPQYSQPSRYSIEQQRNQYSQPSRPSSGQAVQRNHSRLGSQATLSPALPANQSLPNQTQASINSGSVSGKEQTRVHTPQSDKRPSSSQVPKGPTQKPQATADSIDSAVQKKAAAYASAKEIAAKRIDEVRQSPAVDSRCDQAGKPATLVEPQYTTVDPSQVFNHMEYSRRQAAAATEAAAVKKAAEDAEAARIAAAQPKPATPQANGTESDSAKKAQIELEMKQMIEKMRDYKAKDPSLFTQIWEQVKKSQPPQRAPSQSYQGSTTSPIVTNGQLPSPSLIQNQLPPESDLPAGDEFPPDFDRGRFPAQRRRRGGKMTGSTTGRKSGTPKSSTEPVAENQTAGSHQSPVPPEIAIPTPIVGQIFPNPGSQSMQQAMQQFHQNSKSPAPKEQTSGSNKQATTNTPTRPPKATSTAPPSQPVPTQPAPPPKPGGTYWPESKKKALAEAAQIALTSTPPNQAKTITTQEIHELLDQNPSYTQMCEILEYRGFVIDRGQFARTLLKAVPDLGSASTPSNAASTNTASATRATPTNATPAATASINDTTTTATKTTSATSATPTPGSFGKLVKATVTGSAPQAKIAQPQPYSVPPAAAFQAPNGYIAPYAPATLSEQASKDNRFPRDYRFVDPPSWNPDGPRPHASVTPQGRSNEPALHSHPSFSLHQQSGPIHGQRFDQNGATHPNGVTAHHPTKQELARKRTFGEIVDLTQTLSDDEEHERHRPRPRINDASADPSKSVKNIFNHVAQRQQNSGTTTPKPFKYKFSGRDALLQSYDIVKHMNKRRDALRRSTYNPKTIARDVLLGLGKHPTMAPLNAHLDILKDRFKAVDYESDLSTFRWDLVDPEGDAKGESFDTDDEEAVLAVAATRQRPAPVAVMIDGNRGGIVKDDQAPSPSRTVDSGGNPYKRGPYKKRGIPSGIQPIGPADTPQPQSSHSSPFAQNIDNVPSTNTPDLSRFAYNSPYTAGTNLTINASSSSTPESVSKRKGRPLGAKNKQVRPDKGIPKKIKTPSERKTPSTANSTPLDEKKVEKTPSMGKTPPIGRFPTGEPGAPMPTRPRFSTPSRPSGLRNSISAITPTDGIAVVIPSRSPSVLATPQTSVKKARPQKSEDFSNRPLSSTPSYTIYRCHWENCPAELHSIETLKKHVRKHRGAVDDVYPCLWANCSDSSNPISNSTQNEDGQHRRLKFKSEAEWIQHVESNHLWTKLERHDGLSAQSSDIAYFNRSSENESYGRQVVSKVKSPTVLI